MSDQDPKSETIAPATTAPASAAGATAVSQNQNINQIDVHVTVQAPPRSAGGGAARPAAPRRRAAGTSTDNAGNGVRNTGTAGSPTSATPANPLDRDFPGVEENSYRIGGRLTRTFRDENGGSIGVTRNPSTGDYDVTLSDRSGHITTHSNRPGFTGERHVPTGYDGIDTQSMRAVPSTGGSQMYGLRGHVYCEAADGWLTDGQVAASDRVVADVTVNQIRDFAQRHPQLAQMLRSSDLPLTMSGGQTMNYDQIQAAGAPPSRACPVNSPDTIVQRTP